MWLAVFAISMAYFGAAVVTKVWQAVKMSAYPSSPSHAAKSVGPFVAGHECRRWLYICCNGVFAGAGVNPLSEPWVLPHYLRWRQMMSSPKAWKDNVIRCFSCWAASTAGSGKRYPREERKLCRCRDVAHVPPEMRSAVNVLKEEVQLHSWTAPRSVRDQLSLVFKMDSAMLPMASQWHKERRDSRTMGGWARRWWWPAAPGQWFAGDSFAWWV